MTVQPEAQGMQSFVAAYLSGQALLPLTCQARHSGARLSQNFDMEARIMRHDAVLLLC
jgi:hypothetical protein